MSTEHHEEAKITQQAQQNVNAQQVREFLNKLKNKLEQYTQKSKTASIALVALQIAMMAIIPIAIYFNVHHG